MLFTWFMLAGFIFLFSPVNLTNKFQFAFHRIFRWPLSIGRNISLSAGTRQPLGDADVVPRREYNKLQNHCDDLEAWLRQEHEKVEMLSKMRDIPAWERMGFVLSDVITVSIDELRSELIINRGSDDGLVKGQFVLADNSVIGTISYIDVRTARVKLITDSASEIPVKIAGLKAVLKGGGRNLARIPLLSIKHKINIGDIVYAHKPGLLDTAMIIGKVAQCKEGDENPLLWDITVEPVCNIQKAENVVVIVMNPPEVR